MLMVAGFVSGIVLLFFFSRARQLARTIDRCEVAVLKPLAISYLAFTVAFAIERNWLSAAACAVGLLLNNAVGSSLHPNSTNAQLAQEQSNRWRGEKEQSYLIRSRL